MPYELALDARQLELHVVHLGNDLGLVLLGKPGELLREGNSLVTHSTLLCFPASGGGDRRTGMMASFAVRGSLFVGRCANRHQAAFFVATPPAIVKERGRFRAVCTSATPARITHIAAIDTQVSFSLRTSQPT